MTDEHVAACGHCGFRGALENKGHVQTAAITEDIEGHGEFDWNTYVRVYTCPRAMR
jgi:hypothetical protein